jgi:hypothetical protein
VNGTDDIGPYEGVAEIETVNAFFLWVTPAVQAKMVADFIDLADAFASLPHLRKVGIDVGWIRALADDIAKVEIAAENGLVFVGGLFKARLERRAEWQVFPYAKWVGDNWPWKVFGDGVFAPLEPRLAPTASAR